MHHYLQQKQTKRFRNTQSPGKWLSQEETKAPRGAWSEQIPGELGGSSAPSTRLRNLFSLLTPLPPTPEHHSHRGRPLSPLPSPVGPSQRAHGGQQRRRSSPWDHEDLAELPTPPPPGSPPKPWSGQGGDTAMPASRGEKGEEKEGREIKIK